MKAFLRELRRRNVWRATLLYVGAVWALAQGIAQLTPELGLPAWSTRGFMTTAAIGFPIWLAFVWFYEITPDGIRRESEVPEGASISRQTGRKLDYWIIGVLAVAVVLLLADRLVTRDKAAADATALVAEANSVAVLPLANASGNTAEDYFSDGLTEELISGLTRIDALRVIGRTSAFAFKDSKDPRSTIARKLGVAHLLEGNVRRDGERVRIMLELIRPDDGTSVWSQTYSREMKDIFAVQADIARSVATALQVRFSEDAEAIDYTRPPNGNLAAYDAALRGRAISRQLTVEGYEQGVALLRTAIRLEPDYAFAHAILAGVLVNLSSVRGSAAGPELKAEARTASETAMRLAPDYFSSHVSRGYVLQFLDGDMAGAGAAFRQGRMLAPNESAPAIFLAAYVQQLGRYEEAIALLQEAVDRDPLRVDWRLLLVNALSAAGRFEDALEATRRVLEITPDHHQALATMAFNLRVAGQSTEAVDHARRAVEAAPRDIYPRMELAYALDADDRADEALQSLQQAFAIDPDNGYLHVAMSDLLLWQGRYAEALEHARRAVEDNPQNPYFRFPHAVALTSLGLLEEAERTSRGGLAINPQEPWLNATLADIAAQRGDLEAVREAARAETDLDAKRYAQALAAAVSGDMPTLDTAIDTLIGDCATKKMYCLSMAASLRAFARQPEPMFALLGQLEKDPAYRAKLGDAFYRPYYTDPRYLRHLDRYGLSPPSPVSRPARAH